MKKLKVILFFLAFIMAFYASAREFPKVTHTMPGTTLLGFSKGDTLRMEVDIPNLNLAALNTVDRKTSYINTINLVLNNHSIVTEDVKVSISGSVLYQIITTANPQSGPVSLELDFKSGEATKSAISEAFVFSNAWKVELLITDVKFEGANGAGISAGLKQILASLLEVQVTFQEESFVKIDYNGVASNLIACHDTRTDEVVIAWDELTEAEFYELEYTFVDDYTSKLNIHRKPNTIPFNFRNNSTRVVLIDSYYRLPKLFERGYLLYRVRAVGRGGNNLQTPVYCMWTNNTNSGMVDSFLDKIFLSAHMDDQMNWQASTTFAEEGKRSDVVNYFDGTFRARQTVTGVNLGKKDPVFLFESQVATNMTEFPNPAVPTIVEPELIITVPWSPYNTGATPGTVDYTPATTISYSSVNCTNRGSNRIREVIAGETIYDYQGRSAVTILPVPTNSMKIRFFPKLNISDNSGKPYNWIDFDAPNNSCAAPAKLSSSLYGGIMGAAAYYSPNNPNKLGFNAFIPQSEGFPFSQVSYLQDNTGRITAQSGIGKTFQFGTGNNRETSFYYAAPNQAEIDMLFGTEVGEAIRYQKNAVRDPNGQVSVTYLNPAGQTIATALAGETPDNLLALDHQITNQINVSLIGKNIHDTDDKTMITEHQFLVTSDNSKYTFTYDILPETLSPSVCKTAYCMDCIYDISLSLNHVESCTSVPLFSYSGTIGQLLDNQNQIDLQCQNNTATGNYPRSFQKTLNVGTYNLTKKIQVNEQAALAYVNEIMKDTCMFEDLLAKELSAIDTMDCYRSCLNCDKPPVLTADCDPYYCEPDLNRCEIIRNMMLADVSPGGQYASYTRDINGNPTSGDEFSYFHGKFWSSNTPAQQINSSFSNFPGNADAKYLLDNWRPEYAEALLILHPEYCMLDWCSEEIKTTLDFDVLLQSTPYYSDAKKLGYVQTGLSPAYKLLLDNDPWFANGNNQSIKSALLAKLQHFPCPNNSPASPKLPIDELAMQLAYCASQNPPQGQLNISGGNPATVKMGKPQINQPSNAPCNVPPNYFATHTFGSDNALVDLEWYFLRSLYLSAKNDRIEESMKVHEHAQQPACVIRCIGAKKNYNHSFFGQLGSPCNFPSNLSLKDKVRRFNYGMSVYLNAMEEAGTPLDISKITNIDDACAISQAISEQAGTINDNFSEKYYPNDLCFDATECDTLLALLETMDQMLQELLANISGTIEYSNGNGLLPNEIIAAGIQKITAARNLAPKEIIFNVGDCMTITIPYLEIDTVKIAPASICCIKDLVCDESTGVCSFTLVVMYENGVQQSIAVLDACSYLFQSCINPGANGGVSRCFPTPVFHEIKDYLNCIFIYCIPEPQIDLLNCLPNGLKTYLGVQADSVDIVIDENYFDLTIFYISDIGDTIKCKISLIPVNPVSPKWAWESETIPNIECLEGPHSFCTANVILNNGNQASITSTCWELCENIPGGTATPPQSPANLNCGGGSLNEIKMYNAPHRPDPCVKALQTKAYANASHLYRQWADSVRADLLVRYYAKCMGATENINIAYDDKQYHYTLYYYDQAGNLVKTIPPAGVEILTNTAVAQVQASRAAAYNAAVLPGHFKQTVYHYNTLNSLVKQKTPDAGESAFLYDGLGRIAASQNARQKAVDAYSYTLYDMLGRMIESGEVKTLPGILASKVSDFAGWTTFITGQAQRSEITSTQYDTPYTTAISQKFGSGGQRNLRSRVATVMHFENSNKLQAKQYTHATHYSYDIAGNVYKIIQDYPNGVINDKVLVYDYDLQSGKVNSVSYQPGKADQFIHRYGYDAANRLIKVSTSANGLFWDTDAEYFYYRHGPLARLELGTDKVQGLDYFYTLQGFIKGVNGTSFNPETDMGRDGIIATPGQGGAQPAPQPVTINGQTFQVFNLSMMFGSSFKGPGYGAMHSAMARDSFGYVLDYFKEDYKPVSPNAFLNDLATTSGQVKYLYNGNIARMYTQLQRLGNIGFNYRYDQLNRLISQEGWQLNNGSMGLLGQAWAVNLSYGPDGNILALKRNGHTGNTDMDDLSYRYYAADGSIFNPATGAIPKNATNRLAGVSDAVAAGSYPEANYTFGTATDIDNQTTNGNYTYNPIGNLISDVAEGISDIKWNLQNKISQIEKNDGTVLSFEYDALGNRVMKAVKSANTDLKTWYVRDAQGNTIAVYTKNEPAQAEQKGLRWAEAHMYGSSRLGLYKPDMEMPSATTGTTVEPNMYPTGLYEPGNVQAGQGDVQPWEGNATQGLLTPQTATSHTQPATGTNYKTTRGHRHYELSNHLGNVLATLTDRKLPAKDKNGILFYTADLISAQDYYPFGMLMPGRSFTGSQGYRYGFGGQEKDNEVSGNGNSYTAEYWQYDARLGRRWNNDPIVKTWESPYAAFGNNPIYYNDPNGDDIDWGKGMKGFFRMIGTNIKSWFNKDLRENLKEWRKPGTIFHFVKKAGEPTLASGGRAVPWKKTEGNTSLYYSSPGDGLRSISFSLPNMKLPSINLNLLQGWGTFFAPRGSGIGGSYNTAPQHLFSWGLGNYKRFNSLGFRRPSWGFMTPDARIGRPDRGSLFMISWKTKKNPRVYNWISIGTAIQTKERIIKFHKELHFKRRR
ncbi:MAG: hypothetical protein EOM83_02010 [Clostridia bacterium]|nr:hypothetical protein [Clostridia bacterium]